MNELLCGENSFLMSRVTFPTLFLINLEFSCCLHEWKRKGKKEGNKKGRLPSLLGVAGEVCCMRESTARGRDIWESPE